MKSVIEIQSPESVLKKKEREKSKQTTHAQELQENTASMNIIFNMCIIFGVCSLLGLGNHITLHLHQR